MWFGGRNDGRRQIDFACGGGRPCGTGRHRCAQSVRCHGQVPAGPVLRLVPVPTLLRLQPAVLPAGYRRCGAEGHRAALRVHLHQFRGAQRSPRLRPGAGGLRLPALQGRLQNQHSLVRLAARHPRRDLLSLQDLVPGFDRRARRSADRDRPGDLDHRHDRAGDRGLPRPRPAAGDRRLGLCVLRLLRRQVLHSRGDPVEGGLLRQGHVALLDAGGRRLRGRAGGLGLADLPLRPLRRDPGKGGGRQLLHQAGLLRCLATCAVVLPRPPSWPRP